MKELLVGITLIITSVFVTNAQNEKKTNFRFPLTDIKEIVITTNGYIEIENAVSNQIECVLTKSESGKVFGFTNKDEIGEPKIKSQIKDSILFISLENRPELYIIGISTYSEDLKYRFRIPDNITIKIKNPDYNNIKGSFKKLVLDSEGETEISLSKVQIKSLECFSSGNKLKLNGTQKGSNFLYEGTGTESYIIKSSEIEITFE